MKERKKIRALIEKIAELKGKPPYTMRDDLADEEWVRARQAELDEAIEEAREERKGLEECSCEK